MSHRLLQAVVQQTAVGQAGQGVEVGQLVELRLAVLQFLDVGITADVMGDPAGI
jgi:hypothetical protein